MYAPRLGLWAASFDNFGGQDLALTLYGLLYDPKTFFLVFSDFTNLTGFSFDISLKLESS